MTEFMGFVRPNGAVGARNYVLILSGTVYANTLCSRVASMVAGAASVTHPLGRCQVRPDLRMTRRFLAGTGINPNVGAVVIVDHFREDGMTADDLAHDISEATSKPVAVVNIRGEGRPDPRHRAGHALRSQLRAGAQRHAPRARPAEQAAVRDRVRHVRHDVRAGGQPGHRHLLRSGHCRGRALHLAECTEWMGCEEWLTSRAASPPSPNRSSPGSSTSSSSALASGEDIRGSQPTGDNMVGGLTTIEEKSMARSRRAAAPRSWAIWMWPRSRPTPRRACT